VAERVVGWAVAEKAEARVAGWAVEEMEVEARAGA